MFLHQYSKCMCVVLYIHNMCTYACILCMRNVEKKLKYHAILQTGEPRCLTSICRLLNSHFCIYPLQPSIRIYVKYFGVNGGGYCIFMVHDYPSMNIANFVWKKCLFSNSRKSFSKHQLTNKKR